VQRQSLGCAASAFNQLNLLVYSTSTILGTDGLNSADVPLSNKQTNKQNMTPPSSISHFKLTSFYYISLDLFDVDGLIQYDWDMSGI